MDKYNTYEGYLNTASPIKNIQDSINCHPLNSVVFIKHKDSSFGTGARVSRKKILTCAHLFVGRKIEDFIVILFGSQESYLIKELFVNE